MIGMYETVLPKDVPAKMEELLEWYHSQPLKELSYMAEFHAKYEAIHPFQDGSGRIGRLILFRECLKYNLIPLIIEAKYRTKYIEGLKEYRETGRVGALLKLFEEEQKNFLEKIAYFLCEDVR